MTAITPLGPKIDARNDRYNTTRPKSRPLLVSVISRKLWKSALTPFFQIENYGRRDVNKVHRSKIGCILQALSYNVSSSSMMNCFYKTSLFWKLKFAKNFSSQMRCVIKSLLYDENNFRLMLLWMDFARVMNVIN